MKCCLGTVAEHTSHVLISGEKRCPSVKPMAEVGVADDMRIAVHKNARGHGNSCQAGPVNEFCTLAVAATALYRNVGACKQGDEGHGAISLLASPSQSR